MEWATLFRHFRGRWLSLLTRNRKQFQVQSFPKKFIKTKSSVVSDISVTNGSQPMTITTVNGNWNYTGVLERDCGVVNIINTTAFHGVPENAVFLEVVPQTPNVTTSEMKQNDTLGNIIDQAAQSTHLVNLIG